MALGNDPFNLSGMSSPVEIVDQVISTAIHQAASDILFEPQEKETNVRLRVDGLLQNFGTISKGSYDQVLARIKILGNMDVMEGRKPQEAKIRVEIDNHPYVLRAAIVSTNFGQMIALRILDLPQYTEFTQLGMTENLEVKIKNNISGRYGLFLVCGPTGSGKTTTVHACLKHLNNGEVNIMTLEDPVEYVIPGLNQIEVGTDIGMDFASGLKMILRLNPDIVFVGEIRDAETAKIAVQASLTGHLVISTIHARNCLGALYRLLDLGVDPYMVNYAVRAILSQRLLRRICDHCRAEEAPSPDDKNEYQKETGKTPTKLYAGRGCDLCNKSKYHGRIGIFELMELDDKLREMVSKGASEAEMRDKLNASGFVSMPSEGIRLVDAGTTSFAEYLRTMYDAR